MKERTTMIVQVFVSIYLSVASIIFVPYYYWQYAQTHSFMSLILFGEIQPTIRAIVWPYSIFSDFGDSEKPSPAIHHLNASFRLHNRAADLSEKGSSLAESDVAEIIDLYRQALIEARQVDIDDMNRHYAGFGDHYRDEFVKGLEFLVKAYGGQPDPDALGKAQQLMDQWGEWYMDNRQGTL